MTYHLTCRTTTSLLLLLRSAHKRQSIGVVDNITYQGSQLHKKKKTKKKKIYSIFIEKYQADPFSLDTVETGEALLEAQV